MRRRPHFWPMLFVILLSERSHSGGILTRRVSSSGRAKTSRLVRRPLRSEPQIWPPHRHGPQFGLTAPRAPITMATKLGRTTTTTTLVVTFGRQQARWARPAASMDVAASTTTAASKASQLGLNECCGAAAEVAVALRSVTSSLGASCLLGARPAKLRGWPGRRHWQVAARSLPTLFCPL